MSFGGQSNAWERSMMQQHPQSNFHQGPQMSFMQTSQQNNMAAFHSMYPSAGGGGGGSVQYPSRLNPVAFQGSGGGMSGGGVGVGGGGGMPQQTHYNSIGTVTKINNDCGLVNNEVFFYRNVCKGPEPKLGDRVIFEATYSTSGQFKWNATRIQMMQSKPQPIINTTKLSYGSPVPMQNDYPQRGQVQRHASPIRVLSPVRGAAGNRHERDRRDRERERERHHRSRDRDDDEHDRKRRREDHVVRNNSSNRAGGPSNAIARSDRERERDRETRRERERDQSERERERDHPRERERERDREKDKDKEREREKPREPETRSVVPKGPGRRARAAARRYMVQIPKYLLAHKSADVQEVRNRYTSLYIPSDFFHAKMKWTETFTPDNPFSLRRPCQFHIMHRIVESPYEQSLDDLEVADADYVYSAKVMLMSLPSIGEIYRKCFESKEEENVHPTRLINFLVGLRGRNEPMAIGGPWSPSLDGENPDTDPSVLIRTAIRTCKALTGIDLSNCTQWYRFVELYYHRTEYKNMEKDAPPRVETVVIYLPDVHSCMPTIAEHESLSALYKTTYDNVIARRTAAYNKAVAAASTADDNNESTNTEADNAEEGNVAAEDQNDEGDGDDVDNNMDAEGNGADAEDDDENVDADDGGDDNNAEAGEENENGDGEETEQMDMDNSGAANEEADDDTDMGQNADHAPEAGDENEEDPTPEPTHYTLLDLKAMKVQEIRDELLARDLPDDGVRNIVLARLAKALKTEKAEEMKAQLRLQKLKQPKNAAKNAAEKKEDSKKSGKNNDMDDSKDEWADAIDFELSDIVILDEYDSSKNPEDKELTEKEKSQLLRRYTLPTTPHIVVHPNKLAKGGNFDCAVMSLSVLLDYRAEDTKERYFELYLFAELFNEMLMRDFAFNIYKEIYLYHGKEESSENNAEAKTEAEPSAETNGGSGEEKSPKESGKDAESVEEAKPIRKRRMSTVDGKEGDSGGEKKANPPKRRMSTIDGRDIQSSSDDKKLATSSKPQRRMSTVDGPESSNETGKNETGKKMTVAKPHLLLSFLYFDTNQCGYIFERDLEDLFAVLGLNLSRSQIKKVLGKLSAFSISSVDRVRQSIYYRKLTDKEETAESTPCIEDVDDLALEELRDIASGNNKYEFVFGESHLSNCLIPLDGDENNDADLINYNGTVIHVGKLMDQIKRTEKNYSDMEKLYNDLMKQHSDLQKEHSKTSSKIKDLQSDTKSLSRKLTDTNQDLYSLNRKFRDQNSTLSYIYTRVAPYFIREKEKEKDSKSESSPKDKDDKKKDEEKPKDEKEHKDKTPADKHHKDKSKDKESDKEKVKEGGGEKTGHSKEAENVKEKPKPKETEKDKSKETEKEKEKEKNKVTEKGKEKSKETEKEKEKSKETEKEKSKEMEKEKTKETEKEKQKSKETEKENDTSMEVDNDKETEKETCEEKATSTTSTTPKETEKVKKEEDKKEAATPAAAAAPVKTVPVKESSDKVTKPKASETPKPAPATPNAATSTKATVAKAKPAAAAAKPATSTPAKPQAAAAANAKPANATTNAKPAQTSTPAKAVAKTAPNKATPAKATPAKTAPAKQASGTPAKPATAKATPAKVNPNAKKQAAGAVKKVTPSENSQK